MQARDSGGLIGTRRLTVTVLTGSPTGVGAARSGPVGLHPTTRQVWVLNPDNNTVQTIHADTLVRGTERSVGAEPRAVAFDAAGAAWITCHKADRLDILTDAGAVSVPLHYGAAPFGIVMSPDGGAAYVALHGSGEVVRLDTTTRTITHTLALGPTPRALALNADGTRLYITRFLSTRGYAEVWEVDTATMTLARTLRIAKFGGDLHRDSPAEGKGVPNYLAGLALSRGGSQLYLAANKPNSDKGAFSGADLDEENSVRNLVVILDLTTGAVTRALDVDNSDSAAAVTMSPLGDFFLVALQGNNTVAIYDALAAERPTGSISSVTRRAVGGAPQGVVVDPATGRAFVQNLMGRSVTVLELDGFFRTGTTPAAGSNYLTAAVELVLPQVKRGKEIFYNAGDRRMSSEGYISCAPCHVDGGQDGRIWDFSGRGEGLRNTITLHGRAGIAHGNVHWSANFDEIQDFEHDIRGAFGGAGFLSAAQFASANTTLGAPKAGMSADLDALAAYVASLGNATIPRSPFRAADGAHSTAGQAGAAIFAAQNCASCHSGSTMRDGQMHNVGTLRPTSGQRLRGPLTGIDTPTLRGVWATAPYLHDGSAATLADVFRIAGGALLPAELATRAGTSQVVSNDANYVLNYDETAFGRAFVILGPAATLTFDAVNGGAGGLGAVEICYIGGTAPLGVTLWLNGTNFTTTLVSPLNTPPERLINWLTYRFEDLPLRPGADNTIVIEAGANDVLVDHLVVSTADDFALAEPHRRVLALTTEEQANLLAYVRELDGSALPGTVEDTLVTVPPANVTAAPGTTATFQATAIGAEPLTYQWLRNGTQIDGATSATLTLANVSAADAGSYSLRVTGPGGTATSRAATLEVAVPYTHPGTGFVTVSSVGPADEAGQSVTNYTVSNSRPSLFSTQPAIAADGMLTFIPAPNAVGTATVTVIAQDDGGTANGGVNRVTNTFTITVNPVNDAPSFALNTGLMGASVTVLQTGLAAWGKANLHQADVPANVSDLRSIEAGWYHNLAIRQDGSLLAWGWNDDGQASIPPWLTGVAALAGGWTHNLALLNNGTVVSWGRNDFGETNVPAGLSGVIAIAASESYSLALKNDGTVVGWGRNDFGQVNIPAGLTGVIAISAGRQHAIALKSDGTVVAWGNNNQGQRIVPAGLSGVVAIDAGREHNLVLKSDGTLVAWGYNGFGQAVIPAGLSGVTAIAAGDHHNLALKRDGTVVGWGRNDSGQSSVPSNLRNVVSIRAGGFHNIAMFANGNTTVGSPLTVLEDAGAQSISLMVTNVQAGPVDEAGQTVSLLTSNDNPALFSTQPAIAPNGTLTFTPAANGFGIATVSVRAQDNGGTANGGVDTSSPQTFTITVLAVNEPPTFTLASNVVVLEDNGAFSAACFATVTSPGPGPESAQSITNFLVSNSNPTLFSAQPAIAVNGTLTFTPAADANGVATVTVVAQDKGGTANGGVNSATATFTITVTSVNDAPTLTLSRAIIKVATNSGAFSQSVVASASVGPAAEAGQTLSYLITSTSPELFSVQPAISGAGVLSFTVAAGRSGTSTVTLRTRDSGGTANGGVDTSAAQTLVIAVGTQNTPPSFTLTAATVTVLEDAGAQTRANFLTALSPGGGTESTQTVSLTVSASLPSLFAVAPDIDAAGTLTFTPAANAFGSAVITVTATDNGSPVATASQTFTITLTAVNDAPAFTLASATVSALEDAGLVTVSAFATGISAGPANEATQRVTFTVTSDNPALFSGAPAIATNGTLTFTPAANAHGSATVTVVARDTGGTASGGVDASAAQTFTLTVTPVNDAQSFTKGADQFVFSGDGAVTVTGWATGISAGPANESDQTVSFVVTNSAGALFSAAPAVAADGTLTFTPVASASGVVTVGVRAVDDGGTASGGVDSSAVRTFTISLAATKVFVPAALSAAAGDTVTVPVSLHGTGAEKGVAFTLTYPGARLSYTGATAGGDSSGATVLVNGTTAGQLGVMVSMATGDTWAAGSNEVVLLAFTVTGGAATNATLAFGDTLTVRQVSDVDAAELAPVLYVNGSISIGAAVQYEGDVAPRPGGNGTVTLVDAVQIGRYVTGLDTITNFGVGSEFQRADTAPRGTLGDGRITITDAMQAQRYAAGLDPLTPVGGPTGIGGAALAMPQAVPSAGSRVVRVTGGNLLAGRAIPVTIQMDAQGGEAGLSLSLGFDPAALTFVSAAVGPAATGAALVVNSTRAALGRIGLVVMLPAGSGLAAGQRDLVTLTFTVTGSGSTTVSLTGDTPVAREVADVNANVLGANYVNGTFTIVLPPGLRAAGMERDGSGTPRLVIRNGDGSPATTAQVARYEVHVCTQRGGPWTVLPNALVMENGTLKIVDQAAGGAGLRFYKLVEVR